MKNNTFLLSDYRVIRNVLAFMVLCLILGMGLPIDGYTQTNKQITVTGTVKDQAGEPIIGVNVVIKGKAKGTITDLDGKYQLVANSDDILQYRFIGLMPHEQHIGGKSTIDVVLKADVTDLNEVVVVGYGEVKRANLLGSVASMTTKDIEDIPVANMTNLLEGRLAGVHVSPAQPTGNPGASTRIKIRAETTFGTANGGEKDPTPLYVIDGFDASQSDFEMLDPSEVESISVLKDASAAVYGSKGANGVVLVKTKRGKEGKLKVSYSGSIGIMDATMQTEMLSAYDQARILNAINEDRPTYDFFSDSELEKLKDYNYNWLADAWHKSSISRHAISVNGGTDKVQYNLGGTYVYTEGNFDGLEVGKYSYRFGLDAEIAQGLSANFTISLDSKDYTRPYYSGSGANTLEDLFGELLQAPRWRPYKIGDKYVGNDLDFNPFALFDSESFRQSVNKGNNINVRVQYEFQKLKGLKAEASYSLNEGHNYGKDYRVPYTIYDFAPVDSTTLYLLSDVVSRERTIENGNRITETYSYSNSYQFRTTLSYANKFGLHDVSSFILYEQSESTGHGFEAQAEGMVIPNLPLQDAFDYLNGNTDGSMSESGRLGGVARLNYSYADKYLLEAAGRYEGTTKFSPSERMGFFPSLALGWVLSEENFMKDNLSFIDFLKIRGNYGVMGYASLGSYEYELTYSTSGSYLFGSSPVTGMGVSGKTDVISSGVTWEKSKMLNVGFDLRLLEGKLGLNVDIYRTHQTDILDSRSVEFAQTSGIVTMPSENVGELLAWGYDAELSYNGNIGNDFKWYAKAMFNFAANKILARPTQYSENHYMYPIGQSTFAIDREQGYVDKGIIRTQEQLDAINAEWNEKWGHDYRPFGETAQVGMLYYQDIGRPGVTSAGEPQKVFEPDGIINNEGNDIGYIQVVNDHFVLKNLFPTSLSLGGSWKELSFSALFTMQYGITTEAVDKLARTAPTESENSPAFWTDYWSPENPDGAYPHPKFEDDIKLVSSFWMKPVKQLRLNSLNISYSVPSKYSKKVGIPGLRVYFAGTNLWSPVKTFGYKEDAISRYNTYPLLRTLSFGLNVQL